MLTMTSCIWTEKYNPETKVDYLNYENVGDNEQETQEIELKFINNTNTLKLHIKEILLANYETKNDSLIRQCFATCMEITPQDSISVNGFIVYNTQLRELWNPSKNSLETHRYIKILCRITDMNSGIPIWCGKTVDDYEWAIAPVSKQQNDSTLILNNMDEWYGVTNQNLTRILNEITFDPSVEDWKE